MKSLRTKKRCAGFTMIELMIVVLIVAVLAAVAVPLYGKYIRNARITEATGRMGEIITSCKAAAQNNTDDNGNPQWPPSGDQMLDLKPSDNFSYAVTTGLGQPASTNLVVQATGQARMNGVSVSITVDSLNASAHAPVITGL